MAWVCEDVEMSCRVEWAWFSMSYEIRSSSGRLCGEKRREEKEEVWVGVVIKQVTD